MESIRIVIIDDSAFVRKVVREMLSASPRMEVIGLAKNGEDGLQMVEELQPDVVTCDLMMPGLDGVGFVREQMARKPIPILILTASPQDAERVLEALQLGAVDFVQKPTALANEQLRSIGQELIEKVEAAAQTQAFSLRSESKAPAGRSRGIIGGNVDIVVLGVSTGGPQALRYLIPEFAADFPVPLVMVLHMPVGYTGIFAEKLAELSPLRVSEASEGDSVVRGKALLAPAGRHLTFKREAGGVVLVRLGFQPLDKPHRPSVDVLFQSAAETYGRRVLGVVMTGMGDDGRQGAAWIKAQGGTILTESEESCVVYGMPRSVVESGLSDASVPLTALAEEISKRI